MGDKFELEDHNLVGQMLLKQSEIAAEHTKDIAVIKERQQQQRKDHESLSEVVNGKADKSPTAAFVKKHVKLGVGSVIATSVLLFSEKIIAFFKGLF